jgi:hypothetical protein
MHIPRARGSFDTPRARDINLLTAERNPMDRYIDYRNEWGSSMSHLPEELTKPVKLFEGNIFVTKDDDGIRRHYSIDRIETRDFDQIVTVREIKPTGWKAIVLALTLAGGWFLLNYFFTLLGF